MTWGKTGTHGWNDKHQKCVLLTVYIELSNRLARGTFQGLSLEVKSFCPPQAPEDWIRDLMQENTNWDPTHTTQHHANGQLRQ